MALVGAQSLVLGLHRSPPAGAKGSRAEREVTAQSALDPSSTRPVGSDAELALQLHVGAFQAAALHLLPPALTALRHPPP